MTERAVALLLAVSRLLPARPPPRSAAQPRRSVAAHPGQRRRAPRRRRAAQLPLLLGPRRSAHAADPRPRADAVVLQHRRRRLRPHRLRHRRRARLRHARSRPRERTLATLRSLLAMKQGPEPRGVSGYKGFFYHFLDMKTGGALRDRRAVDGRHRAAPGRRPLLAVVLRPRRRRPRRRSAPRPKSSTRASTGRGSRCGRRRSAWAGRPRRASTPTTGAATTRR